MLGFSSSELALIGLVAFLTLRGKDWETLWHKVGSLTLRLSRVRTHFFKFLASTGASTSLSSEHLDLLRKEVESRVREHEKNREEQPQAPAQTVSGVGHKEPH